MSKHIFNTFRQFILSAAFKVLPLRSAKLVEPEPVKSRLHPETDMWLFEAPRAVSAYVADLTREMGRLSGALSSLRSVVSTVSAHTPVAVATETATVFGTLWSDDLLFDGEPHAQAECVSSLADGHEDILFDTLAGDIATLGKGKARFQNDMLAAH